MMIWHNLLAFFVDQNIFGNKVLTLGNKVLAASSAHSVKTKPKSAFRYFFKKFENC